MQTGCREAMLYETLDSARVRCLLCAHRCIISEGKRGICGVRENREGKLFTLVYGMTVAANVDPIEKKPLFHFFPGSRSYSISTVGCNMRCLHCQNWEISQYPRLHGTIPGQYMSPEEIVNEAIQTGCLSISYTYTEPTVYFEFAYDCCKLAADRGIKNVFVSNGYMTEESLELIAPVLDAINIDLKGDDEFYKKVCGARLDPVLNTIRYLKSRGVWVEVTTLVIPGYNDRDEFFEWVADFICSVDPSIPWHVTQFYPTYKMTDRPRTPISVLRRARQIGLSRGLKYVYEGNVPGEGGENTYCPSCSAILLERFGYHLRIASIKKGRCAECNTLIEGVGLP